MFSGFGKLVSKYWNTESYLTKEFAQMQENITDVINLHNLLPRECYQAENENRLMKWFNL
jgi:hypothetical protein